MTLQQFQRTYLITHSELMAVQIEYYNGETVWADTVTLKLKGRRLLSRQKWEFVPFALVFEKTIKFDFLDTFDNRIVSQPTLVRTESGYYLLLDPFDEGQPSERDNMVIASEFLYLLDEQGEKYQLN
ncbi:hypothetical protein F5984_13770 [Rudanella paleaurantiibacter]|uniref:Uncharacterized protein n=2 Tax=Rudanella paleaurantiibacter TaxID=2614655 RepID=A0A7J5TYL2_9BACT|nr:hypothetical protein F5984_13770 [Rudanella paleaurantiibacter]